MFRSRTRRVAGDAVKLIAFLLATLGAVRFFLDTIGTRGWNPAAFLGLLLIVGAIALVWRTTYDLRRDLRRLRS